MKKLLGEKAYNAARAQTAEKLAPMKKALIAVVKNSSKKLCNSAASSNSKSS